MGVQESGFTMSLGKLEPAVKASLAELEKQGFTKRLWDRDPSLWKSEEDHQRVITNSLGWLTVSHSMLEHVDEVASFVEEVRREGCKHAVVLGMGGSSLCPDVCRETFGTQAGYLDMLVLDSSVPSSVLRVEKAIDVARALFLVSSKSGGTTETLSFFKYFHERVRALKGNRAGENFVAITDPGTSLEKLAREKNFRRVFHGHADIGGRYSALSNFGMVPAALAGVDVRGLLERAERMVHACVGCIPTQENPGVVLGATLAELARAGRDKVTLFISPGIKTFGDWVEQLIAESTGKEGKGILPVVGETIGGPEVYGDDRVFVRMQLASEARERVDRKIEALKAAGHPLLAFELQTKLDLGQEFFRWEIATATAGALLGINAFDQPNVQESKDNTGRLLEQFRAKGKFGEEAPVAEAEGLGLYCDPTTRDSLKKIQEQRGTQTNTLAGYLGAFVSQARPGDYLALMAYLRPSSRRTALLQAVRMRLRDGLRVATTLGYGPRFLHSTGQLHKGGANNGLFIQLTADDSRDLPIPGEPYSFSVLKQAQALGDLQSLQAKGRRVVRIHLGKTRDAGLDQLLKEVEMALAGPRPMTTARNR